MGSIIRIILYLVIFALAMVFINTDFVTDSSVDNSVDVDTSSKDADINGVSVFDVFKDTKEQLDSDMHSIDKDALELCEKDGDIEYAQEGKSCKTSSEQVLTCKNGMVKLNNGLSGKSIYLNAFEITLKCKGSE